MSARVFKDDVLFSQRLWAGIGLYTGKLDGSWGPKTQAAQDAFDLKYQEIQKQYGAVDPRSEQVLLTLLPKTQIVCRQFMKIAAESFPLTVKLLSGTRTYAEQNVLYNKMPRVTRARGGQSNHNFGIAWDVGIFDKGQYFTGKTKIEEAAYNNLGHLALKSAIGPKIEWGGDWVGFKDTPHYQLKTGKSVRECRELLEAGKAYV